MRLVRHRPAAGSDGAAAEHADVFRTCEQIAAKTWQADDTSQSTLSSPRVRDVFVRTHQAAAALGMLDVNLLYVGGTPAAFNYNYIADGRTYGLRCGYDPTLELESCGRVLLYMMLEDSFRRGDVEYNFGPGRQPYKERFGTEMRHAYTFRHYARFSLRSQLLHLKEAVTARMLVGGGVRGTGAGRLSVLNVRHSAQSRRFFVLNPLRCNHAARPRSPWAMTQLWFQANSGFSSGASRLSQMPDVSTSQ